MKKLKHLVFLAAVFSAISISASAQQTTPKAAVESFYKFDRSHSQVFNRRSIDARKAWFSPELYNLFRDELRREAAEAKKNPDDKPYFGDGLPFQPLDEVCRAGGRSFSRGLTIKQEFQRRTHAAATATFAYPRACKNGGDSVVYTIGLIKAKNGWVIDDVNYGEDTNLKQRLKRTDN